MIKCQNCGADIEELVPRCPYCGAMNEPGAEHKYMQDLYKLKDDLEDLGEMPQEEISDEVKTHAKFTGKAFGMIVLIALLLVGIFLFLQFSGDLIWKAHEVITHTRSADMREQMQWERKYFPQLDAWYEEENYEAIQNFFNETDEAADGIQYNYSNWEHWGLMAFYDPWRECMDLWERKKNGRETYFYEFQSALYDALTMSYDRELFPLKDEKDREQADAWIADADAFVKEVYDMDEQEIQDLKAKAEKDGFLNYKVIYQYVEENKSEM